MSRHWACQLLDIPLSKVPWQSLENLQLSTDGISTNMPVARKSNADMFLQYSNLFLSEKCGTFYYFLIFFFKYVHLNSLLSN